MFSLYDNEEAIFCINTIIQSLKIVPENLDTISNIGKGNNYTGEIKKLCIKGKDQDKKCVELKLIVKTASKNCMIRKFLSIDRSYQCEVFMYNSVFTIFSKIQEEARVVEHFNSYARYFTSSTKYLNEVLVLEDMTNFKVINRLDTLNYNQALLLVKEVGKFHALSLVLHKKYPELYQDISGKIRNEKREDDGLVESMIICLNVWIPRILKLLDSSKDQNVYDKIYAFSKNFDKFFDLHYTFNSSNKYGVIGHCDLWASNLMFNDENYPSKVCILDWQTARVCSPSVDLCQILLVCCDKKIRHEHGNDLIETYYNSCALHIHQLGEDASEIFPYSVLKEHLNMYSGYNLCIAIKTVTLLSIAIEDLPDITRANDTVEAAEMYNRVKVLSHIFNERIRNIIFDYISYGYNL